MWYKSTRQGETLRGAGKQLQQTKILRIMKNIFEGRFKVRTEVLESNEVSPARLFMHDKGYITPPVFEDDNNGQGYEQGTNRAEIEKAIWNIGLRKVMEWLTEQVYNPTYDPILNGRYQGLLDVYGSLSIRLRKGTTGKFLRARKIDNSLVMKFELDLWYTRIIRVTVLPMDEVKQA